VQLPLLRSQRVLLLVAHPDDEAIGAGALLAQMGEPFVVHVTDGAPRDLSDAAAAGFATRERYAHARREESEAALRLAGIPSHHRFGLGFVDQESSFHLLHIVREIIALLHDLKPDCILTHPYEGGHPDHDSTAWAVHMATQLAGFAKRAPPPVFEFTSYFNRGGRMITGDFLPHAHAAAVTHALSPMERRLKQEMFARFVTQQKVLSQFPLEIERYRAAPAYDFSRAPHPGRLHYEHFFWGVTGAQWRALARQAQLALQFEPEQQVGYRGDRRNDDCIASTP
jgi:N-acetylglucosamine malate deacetylase 2